MIGNQMVACQERVLAADIFRKQSLFRDPGQKAATAGGRMPILVDSGFRRGSDIVKAMAIGAQAVCIGRPYLWGLGAFGQPGVERVLAILRAETRNLMAQMGAPSLKDLTPAMVRRA